MNTWLHFWSLMTVDMENRLSKETYSFWRRLDRKLIGKHGVNYFNFLLNCNWL